MALSVSPSTRAPLTETDVELLVNVKREGNFGEKNGNVRYSNALRQKMKRLVDKLRDAATAR
jgi:hypothetical protein